MFSIKLDSSITVATADNRGKTNIDKSALQKAKIETTFQISNHSAKMCRKTKSTQSKTSPPQLTNINQIESTPDKTDTKESINYITIYRELYEQVYNSNYNSDSDNYDAAIPSETTNNLEPLNDKIQFGNNLSISMVASGSVCTIITKSLAKNIL